MLSICCHGFMFFLPFVPPVFHPPYAGAVLRGQAGRPVMAKPESRDGSVLQWESGTASQQPG